MSTLQQAATEVEIKGALYTVESIAPGEFGVSAVRVMKLVNHESYDVIRTTLNVVECSCPDFVCRHEGKGSVCKHGAAMVARGFLPVVISPPTPAPVAEIIPAESDDQAGDGWDGWVEDGRWELGPEPVSQPAPVEVVPSVDLLAVAPHGMEWKAITPTASTLVNTAPDRTYYPRRTVEPRGRIERDGHRPGVSYGFIPTRDEQVEASDLLAPPKRPRSGGNRLTDWEVRGIDRHALSANEMIEARGFHPAAGSYDDR